MSQISYFKNSEIYYFCSWVFYINSIFLNHKHSHFLLICLFKASCFLKFENSMEHNTNHSENCIDRLKTNLKTIPKYSRNNGNKINYKINRNWSNQSKGNNWKEINNCNWIEKLKLQSAPLLWMKFIR